MTNKKIETAREIAENALLGMPPNHNRDEAGELEEKIIQYAKLKCKEQREICSQVEEITYRVETSEDMIEHRNAVRNANEPIFE